MGDIIKSIKAFLYDRSASPLFGAFLVSWAVWNYRFILYILSDLKVENKINFIDSYFLPMQYELYGYTINISTQFTNGLLVPLILTLLYIYAYPYFAKPVYKFSLKRQAEIREIKQKESDLRLLDEKESREIFQRLAELQNKYNSDTEYLQKHVASLTKVISELEKNAKVDVSKLSDKELDKEIKSIIGTNDDEAPNHVMDNVVLDGAKKYSSKRTVGEGSFDFNNNNGIFTIGEGTLLFETKWSNANSDSIHLYSDPASIDSIALAKNISSISLIKDASKYDFSSRYRTPSKGEVIILKNNYGNYAALQVNDIKSGNTDAEVTFEYVINSDGQVDFT